MVAVLSARGKTTDELMAMAHEVSERPHPREMDMLLSTGERISCALAAMVINDLGHEAISLTGSQAGIVTDTSHTKARILEVRADRIRSGARRRQDRAGRRLPGRLDARSDVTTLGRGGSDTTAVALAAALERRRLRDLHRRARRLQRRPAHRARRAQAAAWSRSRRCSRWRPRARGAPAALRRVRAQPRRAHPLPVQLRGRTRYLRARPKQETMERPLVTAVTHSTDEARVTLTGLPDQPGVAGRVFTALAEANVNVDMIIQNEPRVRGPRSADMSFTVPRADLRRAARRSSR